jgi:non-ribosomal peptide synthetase component F
MLWMQEEFPLRSGDRVLQKTPFGFDASVWEFYAPLIAGAALVMARPGGQREPDYLSEIIRQQNVTIFQAVPALLRAMLDDGRLKECRALRRVFCGGEALTADLERDFFSALDAELINLYGPTETTIEITFWRCDPERRERAPLLGRPITNARVYVLSPRGELCPCGVPGEICVGGVPVGRGYLGRPEETASRFVPDPFAAGSGRRLYRTGDLGRWLPAGGRGCRRARRWTAPLRVRGISSRGLPPACRIAEFPERVPPRLHGTGRLDSTGIFALHAERQGGPAGAFQAPARGGR